MTPFITWHGHDLPLCPPDQQPWPALALTDICRTLAHLPRFNAAQRCVVEPKDRARADATSTPWSVAQHLLLCGLLAVEHVGKDRATSSRPDSHASHVLAALVHDAHEAIIGDITTPVALALGDNAKARLDKLKLDVDAQLTHHRGTELAMGLRASNIHSHTVAGIDHLALHIERAAFVDWAHPRNTTWFDRFGQSAETDTHLMLRIASGPDFARLRRYTPADAARELELAINKFATLAAAAAADAEAANDGATVNNPPTPRDSGTVAHHSV